jgi:chlorite dismutase
MLAGLRSDADILFWRMSDDLEFLQENCARTFSAGIGRYFLNIHSFLGVHQSPEPPALKKDLEFGFLPKETFGLYKFMLIHPVVKSHVWYELSEEERKAMVSERASVTGRYREIRENFFTSYGLDAQEMVVAREARHLDELINATRELRELRIKNYTAADIPVFLCVGRDLREILDAIC